jgi:sodium/bile acid cotransporter 7
MVGWRRFLKQNGFLLGLLGTIALSMLFPAVGQKLNPASITLTGVVVLIFFNTGLTLPTEAIRRDLREPGLHAYIQAFIFFITPLFFVVTSWPLKPYLSRQALIGIYALSCVPTTISSCIILTQRSGGNVVAAVFNATLANTAGIVVSPLVLSFLLRETGQPLPLEEAMKIFRNLLLQLAIPLLAGQGARAALKGRAERLAGKIGGVNNLLILAIVFFALSKAAGDPLFKQNLTGMGLPFGYLAAAHLLLVFLAYGGARLLGFRRENAVTALFTAPQKSISAGIPIVTAFFSFSPGITGIALLPLLFYHPWQLLVAGLLSGLPFLRSGALPPQGP